MYILANLFNFVNLILDRKEKLKWKLKLGGEMWHEELPHSGDNRCPECGDGTLWKLTIKNVQRHIVGLDDRCSYKVTAILKCPKCESLFWFHLDLAFAILVLQDMEER
jgi:uncharacterized protein with PIN domain